MQNVKRTLGVLLVLAGLIALNQEGRAMENPFFASSSGATDNAAIYGFWGGFPEMSVGGNTYSFHIGISENRLTNRVFCKFSDGVSLQVDVSAKAVIGPTTIQTTESAQNSVSSNGHTCQGSIRPDEVQYVLESSDRLTLSASGQTMTLTRVAQ